MQQYKIDFVKFLVKAGALKFGTFTLKSGRIAPYFVNMGSFYTGEQMSELSKYYAQAFLDTGVETDVIFGPAYKGIPLAVATVQALFSGSEKNLAYAFNRKEAKDHGEKDIMIGAPLNENTKVFLIDDVITAGTAIKETADILKANGNPKIRGVLIALNRMEKNNEGKNALTEVENMLGVKVFAIVNLDDVIEILYNKEVDGTVYIDDEKMEIIKKYRAEYGI